MKEQKLATRAKKTVRKEVSAAIDMVTQDELESGEGTRLPVNIHPKLHRWLKTTAAGLTNPTGKTSTVKMRMIVIEALVDVQKKYEDGNGKYPAIND